MTMPNDATGRHYDICVQHPVTGVALYFDAESHRYWTERIEGERTGMELVSVTTFVKHYFAPFDAQGNAARMAAKPGEARDAMAIIAEWEAKRDASSRLGTRVHQVAEDAIEGRAPRHSPESDRERALMSASWQAVADMKAAGWIIQAAEYQVFSERIGLAGTIDFIARDPDGVLTILDWKTNETINMYSKYGNVGLGPCFALPDCNGIHYALQLHTYAAILRLDGYTDEHVDKTIFHVTPDGVVPIAVVDVDSEVIAMLLDFKLNPWHLPF